VLSGELGTTFSQDLLGALHLGERLASISASWVDRQYTRRTGVQVNPSSPRRRGCHRRDGHDTPLSIRTPPLPVWPAALIAVRPGSGVIGLWADPGTVRGQQHAPSALTRIST